MVSKNGTGKSDLLGKLNYLEDQVTKLSAQIKANKQTISELKIVISQRDVQIHELELKLGFAQQSLLEKVINKIQQCRIQIKTGIDEKVINPTVRQIQQHIKTVQEFVDEAKEILSEKKMLVDDTILIARDKLVQCPDQAKIYVEKSLFLPAQASFNKALESINIQAITTRNLVENKAIYPGKVLYDEIIPTAKSLSDKFLALIQTQVIAPVIHASNKVSAVANNIYPDTLVYLSKKSDHFGDIYKQALSEIADQIKKSPFWDGKNKLNANY